MVATYVTAWLRAVTLELAPSELRLSDCALTMEGFERLMNAIDNNGQEQARVAREASRGLASRP